MFVVAIIVVAGGKVNHGGANGVFVIGSGGDDGDGDVGSQWER